MDMRQMSLPGTEPSLEVKLRVHSDLYARSAAFKALPDKPDMIAQEWWDEIAKRVTRAIEDGVKVGVRVGQDGLDHMDKHFDEWGKQHGPD